MRRKLIEKTAILVVSITVISGCGVSYKDYSDTNVTQEDIEKPDEIETRCEYVIEDEVAKLPSDVVIIDDYSKEGTNLYFAITKDGKPVDPVSLIEGE